MKNTEKTTCENLLGGGVEWYKEKIIEMVGEIEEKRFLKAVYISMSDYLKEKEPD